MRTYDSTVAFQTFNYGDKESVMKSYCEKKNMPLSYWRINKKETVAIRIEAFPTFLVLDKQNAVLLKTSGVPELQGFLKGLANK